MQPITVQGKVKTIPCFEWTFRPIGLLNAMWRSAVARWPSRRGVPNMAYGSLHAYSAWAFRADFFFLLSLPPKTIEFHCVFLLGSGGLGPNEGWLCWGNHAWHTTCQPPSSCLCRRQMAHNHLPQQVVIFGVLSDL